MKQFLISTVNNPDLSNTDHTVKPNSKRESRVMKQARRLAKANGNIILWRRDNDQSLWHRISILRNAQYNRYRGVQKRAQAAVA